MGSTSWWRNQTPEKKQQIYERRRRHIQNNPDKKEADRIRYRFMRWATSHNSQVLRRCPTAETGSDISNQALKEWLEEKFGCTCPYCGQPADSIDHVVPLAKGGTHTFSNLELICGTCNKAKNALTRDEYQEWIANLVKIYLKGN